MTKKVLIIDDDPLIRSTLEQSLKLEGVETFSAENGKTGLNAVRDVHPDLIVLDHYMPVMTGVQFLAELRSDADIKDTKVVYLTSDADIARVNEVMALGVNTYLNKTDVQMSDIIDTVKSVL